MTEDIEVQDTDILEEDPELVPADRRSTLESTLKGAPFSLASWFSRKARSAVSWIGRGVSGARGFFRAPKTNTLDWASRTRVRVGEGARRTRRELDAITTVQLIAVVGIFSLFLILPLISVAIFAFTNSAGNFTLDHFFDPFRDPKI